MNALKPGDGIPAEIMEGLGHSRVLVLCMSAKRVLLGPGAVGVRHVPMQEGAYLRDPLNKVRCFLQRISQKFSQL